MATDINRTTSIALPGEVSSEILQKTQESSAVMSLAQQIKLPGLGVTIPVITGDPEAAWVAETEKKPVKRGTLDAVAKANPWAFGDGQPGYPDVRDGGDPHHTPTGSTSEQFADWFAQVTK